VAEVTFSGVSKVFADGTSAVSNMDLVISDGEFVVLVGPSGCGKSTALRMLAGLESVTSGTVSIGGKVVNDVAPRDRDIAMVFQNYALYPHMKVYDNIAFGLRLRKVPKDKIDERVRHAAQVLGLEDVLDRKPRALSGGQRQRVAMGRAIVREPQAFLMDEPLSNLDAQLRVQMRAEISSLQDELGVTTVYVTHDQIEAMTMGDRVAVMRKGALQQVAPPQELYDHPVNLFVGGFIGSPTMNMMEATVEEAGDGLRVAVGEHRLTLAPEALGLHPALRKYVGRKVVLGVRPEDLEDPDIATDMPTDQRLSGKLMLREALGSEIIAHFEIQAPPVLTDDTRELAEDVGTAHHFEAHARNQSSTSKLVARFNARTKVREGEIVDMAVDTRALHFFEVDTGLGIYEDADATTSERDEAFAVVGSPSREDDDHVQAEEPSA
jgi:multiple sugar transport system ATP-binding protein